MLCLDFKAFFVVKLEGWWGGRHIGGVDEIRWCALAKNTDLRMQARKWTIAWAVEAYNWQYWWEHHQHIRVRLVVFFPPNPPYITKVRLQNVNGMRFQVYDLNGFMRYWGRVEEARLVNLPQPPAALAYDDLPEWW
jgi:hypothetical protein